MDDLKEKIAGEITLSENVGDTIKKWRELFGISQTELAKYLDISTSTISDYEANRRLSPGISIIKRFVDALFTIDETRGGTVTKSLENFRTNDMPKKEPFYTLHEFNSFINGNDFNTLIDGKIIANPSYLDTIKIFGYTFLDSLRVILEMAPMEYPKLFGVTTERAFLFDNVSTGRSPMVVIRVAPIKPKIVVLLGLTNIDKLAIKLAQVEKIPLISTKLSIKEINERLSKI